MPPDPLGILGWLDKADQDRSAARRLFAPGCVERSIIAFHCQQAVEKLLKVFLIANGVEPDARMICGDYWACA